MMSDGAIDLSLRFRTVDPSETFGVGSDSEWPTVYQRVQEKMAPLSISCSNKWMMQQHDSENHNSILVIDESNGCLEPQQRPLNADDEDSYSNGLVVETISPFSSPPSLGYVFFNAAKDPRRMPNVEDSMYPPYVRLAKQTGDDENEGDSDWRAVCAESMGADAATRCGKRWPSGGTNGPEQKRMLFCRNDNDEPKRHYSDFESSFDEYAMTWKDRLEYDERRKKAVMVDDIDRPRPQTSASPTTPQPVSANWKKNNRVPVVGKIVSDDEVCGEVDEAKIRFDEYTRGLTATTADGSVTPLFDVDGGGKQPRPLAVSQESRYQRLQEAMSQKHHFRQPMLTERSFEVAFPPTNWTTPRTSSTTPHFDGAAEGYCQMSPPEMPEAQLPPVSSFGSHMRASSPFGRQHQDNRDRQNHQCRYPSVGESTSPPSATNVNGTSSSFGLSTGSSEVGWAPDATASDGSRSGVLIDAETMMKMMRKISGSRSEVGPKSVTTLDDVHLAAVADQIVSYVDRDDAYRERRRKNNEAAKRSRDYRRQKERSVAKRAEELKVENVELKAQVMVLSREVHNLQGMLIQQRMIATKMNGSGENSGGGTGSNHGNMGGLVDGNGGTSLGIMA